jgi:hypothetical protein
MKRLLLTLFLMMGASGVMSTKSLALDMNVMPQEDEKLIYVNMWGSIDPGDDQKFRSIILPYLRNGYIVFQINIFSPGGNVQTAMKIGDQIRTLQTRTVTSSTEAIIHNNRRVLTNNAICIFSKSASGFITIDIVRGHRWCTCESACFLVWASGITRQGGRIGIHRFYWRGQDFGNLPVAQARELYQRTESEFRTYVNNLNVPATIVDRLFATDSHGMYFLSWPEIQLLDSTPFLEEMVYSKCGKSKHQSMSAANNWTSTEDPAHVACYRSILKELMREGTKKYLTTYSQ